MADNLTQLPVNDASDVLAILPSFLRPDDPAEVRDAILAGLTALCLGIQDWADYAAAQADVLRATGKYEDGIGAERQLYRNGAGDEAYRAVQLTPPAVVTPEAILAAVNALLAPFSDVTAKYCESRSDAMCLRDETIAVSPTPTGPYAYVYDENETPRSPDYFDRFYESEATENAGFFAPGREPGGPRLFADTVGRLFLLQTPDLSSVDGQDTPVYQQAQTNDFYVGAGALHSFTSYVLAEATTAATLYAQIINVVNRIKGQSVRWILLVDPLLVA